jgi:hypothetical protein
MTGTDRALRDYLTGCAALIGYALGYALPIYAGLPRAIYDPIARRWLWAASAGPIPMSYLGQVLFGLFGALACGLIMRLIAPRLALSARGVRLAAAWALTALALSGAYFTWNNWP